MEQRVVDRIGIDAIVRNILLFQAGNISEAGERTFCSLHEKSPDVVWDEIILSKCRTGIFKLHPAEDRRALSRDEKKRKSFDLLSNPKGEGGREKSKKRKERAMAKVTEEKRKQVEESLKKNNGNVSAVVRETKVCWTAVNKISKEVRAEKKKGEIKKETGKEVAKERKKTSVVEIIHTPAVNSPITEIVKDFLSQSGKGNGNGGHRVIIRQTEVELVG